MNSALEFHDSRVSSITSDGTHVSMRFGAAYLHESEGVPGVDEGTGWVQEGQLVFSNAVWRGSFEIEDGWLIEGELTAASEEPRSMIPVPRSPFFPRRRKRSLR